MTTPSLPPVPETPTTPPKKGLPVIAWVGIGCGGLVVLGVIVIVILGVIFGRMAGDVVAEMEKNPAKATVMIMAKIDSDIEIVSSDDAAKTVTVKMKSTGDTFTLSMDDIEKGKFPGKLSPDTRANPTEN